MINNMATLPASEFKVGIMMECGCAASGNLRVNGGPALVCCGVHDCTEVAAVEPDLTGRKARCSYGGKEVPSCSTLAFFKHRPTMEYDEYYCGCFGWDWTMSNPIDPSLQWLTQNETMLNANYRGKFVAYTPERGIVLSSDRLHYLYDDAAKTNEDLDKLYIYYVSICFGV